MKVAILHYWFLLNGGGETVVDALLEIFPMRMCSASSRMKAAFLRAFLRTGCGSLTCPRFRLQRS